MPFLLILLAILSVALSNVLLSASASMGERWSVERAQQWQALHGFRAGVNFIPSTADNELEMFQKETYDPTTIDRELGFAQGMGFTTIRVFLHNLLWDEQENETAESAAPGDSKFLSRLENFLTIADKRGFNVLFVLLDSCWNPDPHVGVQPEPITGMHNSQWVQAPGEAILKDEVQFKKLKSYVMGVVRHFKDDSRVVGWDVWNEPNNSGYTDKFILPLITQVFAWIREVNPSQPLTTPVWRFSAAFNIFEQAQMNMSDIISFHNYEGPNVLTSAIANLKRFNGDRPLICTEYMARTAGSHFEPNLQILKDFNINAYNWGLVNGRTMTIYDWSTCAKPATEPPAIWFHDIVNPDGSAFNQSEITYIQSVLLPKL